MNCNGYDKTCRQAEPLVLPIPQLALQNCNFRTEICTGSYLQLTLMTLPPGECIGLEMHPDVDQLLRVEQGQGIVEMGCRRTAPTYRSTLQTGDAIFVPAGTWHNLTNTGRCALRLSSVYGPPNHPAGTIHPTKRDAEH